MVVSPGLPTLLRRPIRARLVRDVSAILPQTDLPQTCCTSPHMQKGVPALSQVDEKKAPIRLVDMLVTTFGATLPRGGVFKQPTQLCERRICPWQQ